MPLADTPILSIRTLSHRAAKPKAVVANNKVGRKRYVNRVAAVSPVVQKKTKLNLVRHDKVLVNQPKPLSNHHLLR